MTSSPTLPLWVMLFNKASVVVAKLIVINRKKDSLDYNSSTRNFHPSTRNKRGQKIKKGCHPCKFHAHDQLRPNTRLGSICFRFPTCRDLFYLPRMLLVVAAARAAATLPNSLLVVHHAFLSVLEYSMHFP